MGRPVDVTVAKTLHDPNDLSTPDAGFIRLTYTITYSDNGNGVYKGSIDLADTTTVSAAQAQLHPLVQQRLKEDRSVCEMFEEVRMQVTPANQSIILTPSWVDDLTYRWTYSIRDSADVEVGSGTQDFPADSPASDALATMWQIVAGSPPPPVDPPSAPQSGGQCDVRLSFDAGVLGWELFDSGGVSQGSGSEPLASMSDAAAAMLNIGAAIIACGAAEETIATGDPSYATQTPDPCTCTPTQPALPITAFPFTASVPHRRYALQSNATSASGDMLTIAADSVCIDLNGFTVTWADAGPGRFAIWRNTARYSEIRNGTLNRGAYVAASGERVMGIANDPSIDWDWIHRVNIHNLTGSVGASDAAGKDSWLHLEHSSSATYQKRYKVHNCNISATGQSAASCLYFVQTNAPLIVHSNTLAINATAVPSARNGQCVWAGQIAAGSLINNNATSIGASTDQANSYVCWETTGGEITHNVMTGAGLQNRGIIFDGSSGAQSGSSNMVAAYNDITMAGTSHSGCIRNRSQSQNNYIHHNRLDASLDTSSHGAYFAGTDGAGPIDQAGVVVERNWMTSPASCVELEGPISANTASMRFVDNTYVPTGQWAVYVAAVDPGDTCDDVDCVRGQWNGGQVSLNGPTDNWRFCNTGLTTADIVEDPNTHVYTIQASDC